MGRSPCCSKVGLHRGPWTAKEDMLLKDYITTHGEGHWRNLPKNAGLLRCGKSCRLRWMNYLRPDIKRGNISHDEEELIIRLHSLLGNRWSLIAGRLPGRTDNEIKNFWNTHISKNLRKRGIDPLTHKPIDPQKSHTHSIHLPKPNRLIAFHEANDTHCSSNNEEGKGYENVCCASEDQQNVEAKEIGIDMEEGDCDFMKDFIQNPNISSSSPESIDMNLNMELIAKELEEIDYTALLERYEGKMWDDMLADPQSHTQSLEH